MCRVPVVELLIASVLVLGVAAPVGASTPKNVLILSEGPIMPYAVLMRQRIVAALRPDSAEPLNVYEELIDSIRFASPEYDRQMVALYKAKYANANLSLVITITEPSLDFALRHRDELFSNVPLAFGALDERAIQGRALGPDVTGLFSHIDARETIATALALHPAVRRIAVVGGSSRFDRGLVDVIRQDLRGFESRASVTYIVDRPLRDTASAVAALGDDALVLFISMQRDSEGVARNGPEVLAALRPVARAPIYGMSRNYLGRGIVGGFVLDYEQQGTDLGRRARRLLDGVPVADLPPARANNPLVFDWSELRRFGIDEARLPAGATVVNRVPGLWDQHQQTVLVAAGVLIGQSLLIGGLLVQRRRRRRAELALHDLSGRLLSAQEDERRRIARDLHDNLSQQMAMLSIGITQVAKKLDASDEPVARSVRELGRRTVEISNEIHDLSHQLHSTRLEMLGLVEALRGHCQELLAQGMHAIFLAEGVPESLPRDVELCLFRIAQEALNNVVKHSGAREAQVTLRGRGRTLTLSVADSGRGFEFEGSETAVRDGLGLSSMRERLRLLDGEFTVRSQRDRGTTIVARLTVPDTGGRAGADAVRVASAG